MSNYKIYSLSESEEFTNMLIKHLNKDTFGTRYNLDILYEHFKVEKQIFADKEINIKFNESVRGESLIIVAQLNMPYENLFELILACDAAKRCDAKEIILIIPYLPHSRQERRGDSRSPITARVIADLLQNAGVDHIISMDLHIGAIEGFYSIPFDKLQPNEIFLKKIESLNLENLCLVSPDFGFMKKMEYYQEKLKCDMFVINKKRLVANKIDSMELIGGDVKGKNVVIIDDIIDTAGTLVKAADLLLSLGAANITVFATHGVLSYRSEFDNAVHRLNKSKISKVYISNTIDNHITDLKDETDKISYIDISSIFATAIKKLQTR